VPLLWQRGRLRLLLGRAHVLSAVLAAIPCLAWAWAVAARIGWEVLYDTVRREALQHLSPAHHPRPYPWREVVEFPVTFLLTNLPWSAFALITLHPRFARLWDERSRRLLQLLHCWTWANLLFWSLVPGHRPRHGLPLQPALAGLAAFVWIAWLSGRLPWPWPRLRPSRVLATLLMLWLVVKLLFVQVVLPGRNPERAPSARGEQIAALVPEGEMLYLFRLKDEGILFYYGRPAQRLHSPEQLPAGESRYCLLVEAEWQQWPSTRPAEVLRPMQDEQGAPLVFIRTR
jgi:hypothetical protein